jgi:hypothetical protein
MTKLKIYILNKKTVPFQRHYSFSSSGSVSTDRRIDSTTKVADCFSYEERFTANAHRPLLFSCNNVCILYYKSQRRDQAKRGEKEEERDNKEKKTEDTTGGEEACWWNNPSTLSSSSATVKPPL